MPAKKKKTVKKKTATAKRAAAKTRRVKATVAKTRPVKATAAKVLADVLASRAVAAGWAGKSEKTIARWEKDGLQRLAGGGYSKKLIKEYLKNKDKAATAKKMKPIAAAAAGVDNWENLDEGDKQLLRMRKKRQEARSVTIGKVINPKRRQKGEKDSEFFLLAYFPEIYYNPFSDDQKQIIAEVDARIKKGGWKAIAAERGGGKSSIVRGLTIKAIVYGLVKYLVILAATGPASDDIHDEIKDAFEYNDLLAEDFPEVCGPIRALEGAPQRAGGQLVGGERTRLEWSSHRLIFPYVKVKGKYSAASGVVVTSRGMDAQIRGLVKGAKRPDFVLTDDVETRASAESEVETARRMRTLKSDILGLVGPGEIMPVVLLGTIIKRGCMMDQITDRKIHPAWDGVRHKRLKVDPKNIDLWEKYIEMRQRDQLDDDQTGRNANTFYLENREKMDAGSVVSNKYRYKSKELADGSLLESSALQSCYNDIADMGREAFNAEYQGEPMTDGEVAEGVTLSIVQKKLTKRPCGIAHKSTFRIVGAIDVHRRQITYSVTAFRIGAIGEVIDYGSDDVNSPAGNVYDADISQAVDEAIYNALLRFDERVKATGYAIDGGGTRGLDLCLIDARWHKDAIYRFCQDAGGIYKPSMGYGKNSNAGKFRKPAKNQKAGQHWKAEIVAGKRLWSFGLDVDYYKQRVHDGFMIDSKKRGSLSVYGDDPVKHRLYAEQILAEVWVKNFVPGKGWVEGFVVKSRRNHFLDTTAQTIAAADLLGINLVAAAPTTSNQPARSQPATGSPNKIRTKY